MRTPKDYITLDRTACEELVCKEMSKLTPNPLSETMSGLLIKLITISDLQIPTEITEEFVYKVIKQRLTKFKYDMDDSVILLLMIITGSPGTAIMYLFYFQYLIKTKYPELLTKKVSINDFCMKLIPWGVFSDEDLTKVWDNQKLTNHPRHSMDNIVDHPELCESLFD